MLSIDELYNMLSTNKKSLFNTKNEQKIYNCFYKKYISPLAKEKGLEFEYNALIDYCNLIETERKIAFENGFQAAVSLIFNNRPI